MKHALRISFLFSMLLIAISGTVKAQPRYGIYFEEMCWRTLANGDSSIVRFSLVPSQTSTPTTLYYTNADNATINVSGGTLELCWCGSPVDVSNPPAFDPEGCIIFNQVVNPFNPPDTIFAGVGYQGFLSGVMDASQIAVTFEGSPFLDWTYNTSNGYLKVPESDIYIRYPQADAPKTLQIIATNIAGSDTLTCVK